MWVHDNVLEHVSEWTLDFGIYIIFLILQMRKDFDPKMVSLPVKEVELNTTDRLNVMSLSQSGLTVSVGLCNMAFVLDAEFKVVSQFSVGEYDILAMCQDYCGTMYVAATNYGVNSGNGITRFNQNGKKLSQVILPPTLQEKNTLVTSICTGPGNNMYYRITSVHAVERKMESFICRVGCKSNSSTVIMEEMPFYYGVDDVASEAINGIMCHSDGNIYAPKATGISIINGKGEKLRDIATQEMDFSTTDNDGDYSDDDDSDDDYSDDDDSDFSDSDIGVPEASGYILRSSLNGHLFLSKTRSSLIKILSLEGTLLGTINLEEAETSSNNHLIGMDVTSDGYLQVCRLIADRVIKVFFY